MKINVQDSFYHYCNRRPLKLTHKQILENIFEQGLIMNRVALKKRTSKEYFNSVKDSFTYTEPNALSLAFNPLNHEYEERFDSDVESEEDAFEEILGNGTLIINPRILRLYRVSDSPYKMCHEVQIYGSISTKFVDAIGVDTSLKSDLCDLLLAIKKLRNNPYTEKYYDIYTRLYSLRYDLLHKSAEEILKEYYDIKMFEDLIEEKELDIPIVNMKYGYEADSSAKMLKRIKRAKRIYSEYKNS